MLKSPIIQATQSRDLAKRNAAVTIALVIAAVVAVFVALSTVTPVAFAALGFLPLIQHRLMTQISSD